MHLLLLLILHGRQKRTFRSRVDQTAERSDWDGEELSFDEMPQTQKSDFGIKISSQFRSLGSVHSKKVLPLLHKQQKQHLSFLFQPFCENGQNKGESQQWKEAQMI